MALIKCSECGSDVSEKASACPKCGCPIDAIKEIIVNQKKKKTKNIIKGVATFAVLALIIIAIVMFINRPNTDGYYQDTKWGMSIKQVKKELGHGAKIIEDKESVINTIEDYEGKTGIDAMISCDFKDESLQKVTLFLTNGENSLYTDSKLIDEYTARFDKLYGESEQDGFTTFWNSPKSRIEIFYFTDELIIISYEDITKVEED